MSGLQKEAIQMINGLSDDNLRYLIDFIKRFMLPQTQNTISPPPQKEKMQAFYQMEEMKAGLSVYFPSDYNPEKDYMEAIDRKYGNIG